VFFNAEILHSRGRPWLIQRAAVCQDSCKSVLQNHHVPSTQSHPYRGEGGHVHLVSVPTHAHHHCAPPSRSRLIPFLHLSHPTSIEHGEASQASRSWRGGLGFLPWTVMGRRPPLPDGAAGDAMDLAPSSMTMQPATPWLAPSSVTAGGEAPSWRTD
jgi:hypothetical protein